MPRAVGLALVVVLTLLGTLCEQARDGLWRRYNDYRSPYLAELQKSPAQPPLTNRVVIILIRGLSTEVSQTMPGLNQVRDAGADYTLQTAFSPFHVPQLMTLLTGASPEIHGFTTNVSTNKIVASSIVDQVVPGRPGSAVLGSRWWEAVFGRQITFTPLDFSDLPTRDAEALRLAREQLADPALRSNLMIIELDLIEQVHNTEPANLSAAISTTDARVSAFMSGLDLARTTILITSDRGTQSNDGDLAEILASRVPLVMTGAGVRLGAKGATSSLNFAATVAALLGTNTPAQSLGTPIFGALAIAQGSLIDHVNGQATRLVNFYEHWSEVTKSPRFAAEMLQSTAMADAIEPVRWLRNFEAALGERADSERRLIVASAARGRLPLVAGTLLCLVALAGLLCSRFRFWPVAFVAVYWTVWFVWSALALPVSSALGGNPDGNTLETFAINLRGGSIALLVTCALAIIFALRQPDALIAVAYVMTCLVVACLSLVIPILVYYWSWGADFSTVLPDGNDLMHVLAQLTQLSALNMQLPAFPALRFPLPVLASLTTVILHIATNLRR